MPAWHMEYLQKGDSCKWYTHAFWLFLFIMYHTRNLMFWHRNIPEAGTYHVGDRIPEIRPPPGEAPAFSWADHVGGLTTRIHAGSLAVGKCFDCKLAINWRKHYELTGREYVLNDDVDSWYCAGGGYPPERAPQGTTRTHGIGATALARMGRTPILKTARAASPVPEGGTAS